MVAIAFFCDIDLFSPVLLRRIVILLLCVISVFQAGLIGYSGLREVSGFSLSCIVVLRR